MPRTKTTGASVSPVVVIGGGQSGLAAAHAAREAGLRPVVLEAGQRPVGSWPDYYDSLRLFSPTQFSGFRGLPFPGADDEYPTRDAVVEYLADYADTLDAELRTNVRVAAVEAEGGGFAVRTAGGERLHAAGVVAASGSFSNPYIPRIPGQDSFPGDLLHVAEYRSPEPYSGRRVIVVGGGNSAVQVGYELAHVAKTTIATRRPLTWWAQKVDGRDLHYRLVGTGFDLLPAQWLAQLVEGTLVLDTGRYRAAVESGLLERREMFTAFDRDEVVWADGRRERVDAVLFATGYRPSLDYLRPLGAVSPDGTPQHVGGISTTHLGLVYVGLEFQRTFSSNTLRGVHRDAEYVMAPLAAHVRRAAANVAAHTVPAGLAAS